MNLSKIIEQIKNILIIGLLIVASFFGHKSRGFEQQYSAAILEKEMLEKNLKNIVMIKNNQITLLKRENDTIKTTIQYLPPEGNIRITVDDKDEQTVTVVNRGFTFWPNVGLLVEKEVKPTLGARIYYWDRYGAGLGLSTSGAHLYVDRRVDDYLNFLKNSTAGVYLGREEIGLRLSSFL